MTIDEMRRLLFLHDKHLAAMKTVVGEAKMAEMMVFREKLAAELEQMELSQLRHLH